MEDKRKHRRLDLALDLSYKSLDIKGLGQKGKAKDISESGVCFLVDKQKELPEEMALKISLPGEFEPIFTQGKVAWSKELSDKNLVGIKFSQISRFDRSRIINLIHAKKGKEIFRVQEKDIVILKEIILEDKKELLDMLIERFQDIEDGLKCIDRNVELSKDLEKIDILGASYSGQPMIMEVAIQADVGIWMLALKHFDLMLRNRDIARKLYPYGVDFNQKPGIFVIAREFGDYFRQQHLSVQPVGIKTIEYKCFLTPEGKKGLWLNKIIGYGQAQDAQAELKEAQTEVEEPAAVSMLEVAEFDEQRKRIVSWLWKKR